MYARAIEHATLRLGELRHEEHYRLGLAAVALALAVVASQLQPSLALPLLVGGVVLGILGLRALLLRWELIDGLISDRDAYVIADVVARASDEARMERRRAFAVSIRQVLAAPQPERLQACEQALQALAAELDDDNLILDPSCAVACMHLVGDHVESPLYNAGLPAEALRWRVAQIRSGFAPRPRCAADEAGCAR